MESQEEYVSARYEAQHDSYNSLIMRLDPTPVLDEIRRILLNMYKVDAEKNEYYRPDGVQPKFNEHGVEEFMMFLKGRMSTASVLSKLDKNEINTIVRHASEAVFEFIAMKGDQYDIKESDYSDIEYTVRDNIKAFLCRALGGAENELINKAFTQRETIARSGSMKGEEQPAYKPTPFFGRR